MANPEHTDQELIKRIPETISSALNGSNVGFVLSDQLKYTEQQQLMSTKRAILEYFRIYLSTIKEFQPAFEKALEKRHNFSSNRDYENY